MTKHQSMAEYRSIEFDLFNEYMTNLGEQAAIIERNINQLRMAPHETGPINNLFRTFHNLKGDAALCRFELGVQIAHNIENLLMRLREGALHFSPMLGEAILLAVDRLELAVEAIVAEKPNAHLRLQRLIDGLDALSRAPWESIDKVSADLIENVSGFRPSTPSLSTTSTSPSGPTVQASTDQGADLEMFFHMAMLLEDLSDNFKGRTDRLLSLAIAMNEAAGQPVDATQLEAAVYMHDIGMMLLPESLWLSSNKMDEPTRARIREHPQLCAKMLERMPGWSEAARMVTEHHEMPDGLGYPKGLKDAEICDGAKILAIADAYEAVMLKHRDRGQNISILRAAAEVNACEKQFSSKWIAPFNQVVRKML